MGSWWALVLAIGLQLLFVLMFERRPTAQVEAPGREPVSVAIRPPWRSVEPELEAESRSAAGPRAPQRPAHRLTPPPSPRFAGPVVPAAPSPAPAALAKPEIDRVAPVPDPPSVRAGDATFPVPLNLRLPQARASGPTVRDVRPPPQRMQALVDPRANTPQLASSERLARDQGEFDCVVDEHQPDGRVTRRTGHWGQVSATGAGGIAGALGISARHCVPAGPAVVQR